MEMNKTGNTYNGKREEKGERKEGEGRKREERGGEDSRERRGREERETEERERGRGERRERGKRRDRKCAVSGVFLMFEGMGRLTTKNVPFRMHSWCSREGGERGKVVLT